jgi:MOSC domain-containing protein YiiM
VVRTAIWKEQVAGRVLVRGVNLAGDDQADRSVHGGPDKALYAYASEDATWTAQRIGTELEQPSDYRRSHRRLSGANGREPGCRSHVLGQVWS